jgi:hypothetical protein
LVKKCPYETETVSNHYNYSKPQSKIEHSIQTKGFRTLILKFNTDIHISLYTIKDCDTERIRVRLLKMRTTDSLEVIKGQRGSKQEGSPSGRLQYSRLSTCTDTTFCMTDNNVVF